jgi:hypothetical protein
MGAMDPQVTFETDVFRPMPGEQQENNYYG